MTYIEFANIFKVLVKGLDEIVDKFQHGELVLQSD